MPIPQVSFFLNTFFLSEIPVFLMMKKTETREEVCIMNKLDKAAWQTTLAYYQTWNDVEFLEKFRNAGAKSLAQKWQEFLDLMEFGLMLKPFPSPHEHRQKVEMLNRYYQEIQRFEDRRRQRG